MEALIATAFHNSNDQDSAAACGAGAAATEVLNDAAQLRDADNDDTAVATVRVWFPRDAFGGNSGTTLAALATLLDRREKRQSRIGHASLDLVWGDTARKQRCYLSLWPCNRSKDDAALKLRQGRASITRVYGDDRKPQPITLDWDIRCVLFFCGGNIRSSQLVQLCGPTYGS